MEGKRQNKQRRNPLLQVIVKETVEPEDGGKRFVHFCKENRIEGKVEPKREYPTVKPSLAGTKLEAPGQLRLSRRELWRALFFRADIAMKPDKISPQVSTCQEIMVLPMGWQQG